MRLRRRERPAPTVAAAIEHPEGERSVYAVDIGVEWEPNIECAVLLSNEWGQAVLAIEAHMDDPDQRTVVLTWRGCMSALMQSTNDEARHRHPLWGAGLYEVSWIGEVRSSARAAELQEHRFHKNPLHHYVLPLKGSVVEVIAEGMSVNRSDLPPDKAVAEAL